MDLTWDQVHAEAENLEHAVSDFLVDRIDDYLEHPDYDPHGDPIPAVDGVLRGRNDRTTRLLACEAPARVRLVRVTNQAPDFLRYLSEEGFELGVLVTVHGNHSEAGTIEIQIGDRQTTVGYQAAEHLWVDILTEDSTS